MKLFETDYWLIKLSEDQAYLGRICVVLKRECGDLAELKEEEIVDFLKIVKKFESAVRQTFGATMFNWTCLMNNAYQDEIPQPQVHWHCRPRYNRIVEFAKMKFEDLEFSHHYNYKRHFVIPKEILEEIGKEIKKFLT